MPETVYINGLVHKGQLVRHCTPQDGRLFRELDASTMALQPERQMQLLVPKRMYKALLDMASLTQLVPQQFQITAEKQFYIILYFLYYNYDILCQERFWDWNMPLTFIHWSRWFLLWWSLAPRCFCRLGAPCGNACGPTMRRKQM